jgi:hypothetical protein
VVPFYTIKCRSIVILKVSLMSFEERFKILNDRRFLSFEDETGVNFFKRLNFILSTDLRIEMICLVFGFV